LLRHHYPLGANKSPEDLRGSTVARSASDETKTPKTFVFGVTSRANTVKSLPIIGKLLSRKSVGFSVTFFHPDYTVGSGVSPNHAPKGARGLYHRLGIVTLNLAFCQLITHPTPKVYLVV
jgi:hypothetical protein